MLITTLKTSNFLGLPSLAITFAPFTGIVGPNGLGKSSVRDAIRFALEGQPLRDIELKGNLHELLTDGAEKGFVELDIDGRTIRRSISTGKLDKVALPDVPSCLPWILDPAGFATAPAADKRKGLAKLLGLTTTVDTILTRLETAGVTPEAAATLREAIGQGFDAAQTKAATRATEARGAWKSLTGQNYGSKVAEDWAPAPLGYVPPSAAQALETLNRKKDLEAEVAGLNQRIGAASRQLNAEQRGQYQKWADKLAEYEASQARGLDKRAELVTALRELEAIAKGNSGTTLQCPCCTRLLVLDAGTLREAVPLSGDQQLRAHEAVQAMQRQLTEADGNLDKLAGWLKTAREARTLLDADAAAGEPVDVAALHAELDTKTTRIATLQSLGLLQANQVAEADRHADLAVRAAKEHGRVKDYALAADQLSPNGIPATLLAEVLGPFNAVLAAASARAGWGEAVSLDVEMVLRWGQRRYGMCSRSQQWRIHATLGYAFATLAKFPLLMLDELDMLDVPSRGPTIGWLLDESRNGLQVIAAATFKAAPASIHGEETWVWLDAAVVGKAA